MLTDAHSVWQRPASFPSAAQEMGQDLRPVSCWALRLLLMLLAPDYTVSYSHLLLIRHPILIVNQFYPLVSCLNCESAASSYKSHLDCFLIFTNVLKCKLTLTEVVLEKLSKFDNYQEHQL